MVRILVLALALLCAVPLAHAGAGDAEYYRLRIELDKLASRNAWKGVDRMYNKMLKLDAQLAATDHLLGAQAASNRGATLLSLERLELAAVLSSDDPSEVVAQQAAASQLDGLVTRYGKVELSVGDLRVPALVRFAMPFRPDEQLAIAQAQKTLGKERSFRGLLPMGEYMIDGERFEVIRTEMWQGIKVE
jgi:hypothetical protein